MNITLTSLEALILKATHESLPQPDVAALEAFYTIMRESAEGPQYAAQALAARIHSPNAREAILALSMLDRCMRRGDANFHSEIGKFRFLNEMIKLVSPKHFADKTAPEVRTMVLQLIHAWSIEFPKETKFKVAYDMLKNQGVIKETPPPLPPEDTNIPRLRAKNAIFEDEEKSKLLQKLLQSKKPEDLQHANRLIKTMVREEERRTEANSRKAQEVIAALDSAGLLKDLLEHSADASADEEQLIHELHASCVRLRPVLQRLASSDAQADNLSEILHASDVLDEVFEEYNKFINDKKNKSNGNTAGSQTNNSLLDFAGASINSHQQKTNPSTIDELGDIFNNDGEVTNIAEPLKPVNLMTIEDNGKQETKEKKVEGWHELDTLGEQLMKQSLPNSVKRLDNFNSKHSKKIPMNALETTLPKHDTQTANNNAILDLDFFTKKVEKVVNISPQAHSSKPTTPNDDVMVDISSDDQTNYVENICLPKDSSADNIIDIGLTGDNKTNSIIADDRKEIIKAEQKDMKSKCDLKPLSDINVTLQSVHPSKVPPMTAFEEEDGLKVVLHFCKDKPRPDVNVVVISTTSNCKMPIEEYKFQAVVPKGCKVRLLEASGTSLPVYNPFLPPPALTQLMLLATPSSTSLQLRFVLTYTIEGDTCSEMGEVVLPLQDI
ncbi:ADP-ribosylation factor-binding protein GGA1 isoform X1 [Danaus plexippus]|uniref:ADP-ribosylation factor-binding protein GGA1 isoform X1 n=1 Tax=Danaus plexippus TaxID=13037 RepID=UPI002AB0A869|nr:ADP-ribosylation factor-binding protein GGA1 isoform X1 [Danaus plexippus]